jgi:hypothetical protein
MPKVSLLACLLAAAPEAEFETCDNQAHVLSPPSEYKISG